MNERYRERDICRWKERGKDGGKDIGREGKTDLKIQKARQRERERAVVHTYPEDGGYRRDVATLLTFINHKFQIAHFFSQKVEDFRKAFINS
jgi:hypothetical protein